MNKLFSSSVATATVNPIASLEALQEITDICNSIQLSTPAFEALMELPSLAREFDNASTAKLSMLNFVAEQHYDTLGLTNVSVSQESIVDTAINTVLAPISFLLGKFMDFVEFTRRLKANKESRSDNPLESAYIYLNTGKYPQDPPAPKSFIEIVRRVGQDSKLLSKVKTELLSKLKTETHSRLELYSDAERMVEDFDYLDMEDYLRDFEEIKHTIVSKQANITPETLSKINELIRKLLKMSSELASTFKKQEHFKTLMYKFKSIISDFGNDFEKNSGAFKEFIKSAECFFEEFGHYEACGSENNVVAPIGLALYSIISVEEEPDDKFANECVSDALVGLEKLKDFNARNASHLEKMEKALSKIK